jgi:hypothetical protein
MIWLTLLLFSKHYLKSKARAISPVFQQTPSAQALMNEASA